MYEEYKADRAKLAQAQDEHEAYCRRRNDEHNTRFSQAERLKYIGLKNQEWQERISGGKEVIDKHIKAKQQQKADLKKQHEAEMARLQSMISALHEEKSGVSSAVRGQYAAEIASIERNINNSNALIKQNNDRMG